MAKKVESIKHKTDTRAHIPSKEEAGYEDANAKNTYRYGVGPMLDGLLSQSNFAIITEMTIELMPKPEKTCMFVVSAKDESALPLLVDAIRELGDI